MSELMKKQTTKDFAEIRLCVSADKETKVKEMIENLLTFADVRYSISTEDDTVSLEDVFPNLHHGSAIRGLRYREGLTQAQLAEKTGTGPRHISEMENGKRAVSKEMAVRLAEALNTDCNVFLFES